MREIIFSVCMTAIALSLFKMLLPETALKKQMAFLISCFFLSALLSFFTYYRADLAKGLSPEAFALEEIAFRDFEQELFNAQSRAIEREAVRAAEFAIAAKLAQADIFAQNIFVSINISDEHSISISEVRLVFHNLDELETLAQAMQITQKEVGERVLVTGVIMEESL